MPDPWERQEHESSQAFKAFAAYRDLKERRNVSDAYRTLTGNKEAKTAPSWWRGWATNRKWRERAMAWDAELDRQGRQAQIEAVQDMNRRQADLGREMQRLAGMALRVMRPVTTETINEDGQVIRVLKTDLTPQAVTALAKVGVELERLATGEATERIDLVARVEKLADEMGFSEEDKAAAVRAAMELARNG